MIEVEFEVIEFLVEESNMRKEIDFKISNRIMADTHFLVLAMTYEEYEDRYATLKETYPGLHEFSLHNEYDQAECTYIIYHLDVCTIGYSQ